MSGCGVVAATADDDDALWNLYPRTPWVGECREIIPLTGPNGPDWKATFTKQTQGEFTRMASTAKCYRWIDGAVDEATSKWYPIRLPQAKYTPVGEPGTPRWRMNDLVVGYYETTFSLSENQAERCISLNFEYIGVHYRVWLNGKLAVYNPQSSGHLESHDITPFVQKGANTLRIQVAPKCGEDDSWVEWVWNHAPPGILRPVYLEVRNPVAIERVVVRTTLEPRKEMTVLFSVTNASSRAFSGRVVAGGKGDAAEPPMFEAEVNLRPGEGKTVSVTHPWGAADLWSPATPRLYRLASTLQDKTGTVDQYRVRFGFRELKWKGTNHRAVLNGHPFTMLRSTFGTYSYDSTKNRAHFAMLRKRGFVGERFYTSAEHMDLARVADDADEFGFLLTTCIGSSSGAGAKTDVFFKRNWPRLIGKMMDQCMNNPSIICWGLSNEFGYVYGGFNNMTNAVRQGEVGEWVQKKDPTRPWVCHGDVELRWDKEGPMPIRSLHYPYQLSWHSLPQAGRWYADGKNPWQGAFTNDKPVSVSEDIYHGFQDVHTPMSKTPFGDLIYTKEGYIGALRYCLRSLWEGYCLGGVAGWNPWCVDENIAKNPIFEEGEFSPTTSYLLMLKEFPRNVWGGRRTDYTLVAFNKWFAPVEGTLSAVIRMKGKVISAAGPIDLSLPSGGERTLPLPFDAPKVSQPTAAEWVLTWKEKSGRVLARETIELQVVPRLSSARLSIPDSVAAVLTKTNSPLMRTKFPLGVHARVASALARKPAAVVVHGPLLAQDAQLLDDFARKGGRILQIEPGRMDWCLVELPQDDWGRPHAFAFRRDERKMTSIPEATMRTWWPDGTLGRTTFRKPIAEDSRVLWDSAQGDGVRWADVAWFWRGKGGWLISTVPALERIAVEPIAAHFVQALVDELVNPASRAPQRKVVLIENTASTNQEAVATLFRQFEASFTTMKVPQKPLSKTAYAKSVFVLDAHGASLSAVQKAFVRDAYERRGSVFLIDMGKDEDAAWLDFLGMAWEPSKEKVMKLRNPDEPGSLTEVSTARHFFVRKGNSGLMAGINNEDLFLFDHGKMQQIGNDWMGLESYPFIVPWMKWTVGEPVNAYFVPSKPTTVVLTEPGAIGMKHEKGRGLVVFSTVSLTNKDYGAANLDKIYTVVRAILNNAGCATRQMTDPAHFTPLDLTSLVNAASWRKPGFKGACSGDVEGGDYRYFPVNQCGWSLASNNYCPVEEFPKVPLSYDGVSFKFVDPAVAGGRTILFSSEGNPSYEVKLPRKMKVKKVHFLGFSVWFKGPAFVSFGAQEKRIPMEKGVHFDNYRNFGGSLANGKLVYSGDWDVSPSERTAKTARQKMCVFHWSIENPNPNEPIESIMLSEMKKLGIFAITVED